MIDCRLQFGVEVADVSIAKFWQQNVLLSLRPFWIWTMFFNLNDLNIVWPNVCLIYGIDSALWYVLPSGKPLVNQNRSQHFKKECLQIAFWLVEPPSQGVFDTRRPQNWGKSPPQKHPKNWIIWGGACECSANMYGSACTHSLNCNCKLYNLLRVVSPPVPGISFAVLLKFGISILNPH